MLTSEELDALRKAIPADPDRAALLATLRDRAAPVLAALPPIPRTKALLSRDGGFCPRDGSTLSFDPWSPETHRCPRCGESVAGERHHRNWARTQHLWLAERTAELALIATVTGDAPTAGRAGELLAIYQDLYFALPNRDNVLGPSHLFFSTYLESLWITSYLGAAFLLREAGLLADEQSDGVDRVAEEAAALIGEFNEGLSNRQTWNSTALVAIAAWFDDLELGKTSVESRTGLLGHLTDGFGEDGLWWEGENYHLFALRGLMQGIHWARAMGFDLLEDAELRSHFHAVLLGPTLSALPDFTYPARRDSRYGVSLAQPASLELWEIGRAWLGGDPELESWLAALYTIPLPLPPAEPYDAWLHDAGRPLPAHRGRGDLSWWALSALAPAPESVVEWQPRSALLPAQGVAVLRQGDRYAGLECGPEIGGHGHPDRLQLTFHGAGVHWLPDSGTGAYVQPTLAWYRSALAHNAPRLDGTNAGGADGWCEAFDSEAEWSWCRGRAGEARRTLVLGPAHLLDILEFEASEPREIDLPWHLLGELELTSKGRWEPAGLEHPFVSGAERFVPDAEGSVEIEVWHRTGNRFLRVTLLAPGAELVQANAPGLPTESGPRPFLLLRARADRVRWVTLLQTGESNEALGVTGFQADGERINLTTRAGEFRYHFTETGLRVRHPAGTIALAGLRPPRPRHQPFFGERPEPASQALAPRIQEPPPLDGTLEGFDLSEPLSLDSELQYRRSEEPYDADRFSARAWVNWDAEALYLAVAVSKPELIFRPPDAPPLALDNEPEDINSDSLQVYLRHEEGVTAFLVTPQADGAVRGRSIGVATPGAAVRGRWKRTGEGYLATLRLDDPRIRVLGPGIRVGFDLLVNEMLPDRLRRSGQLVWSGAHGWIYLRGDRQDPSRLGGLELG